MDRYAHHDRYISIEIDIYGQCSNFVPEFVSARTLEMSEAISSAPTPCLKESSTYTVSKINIVGQMKLTPIAGVSGCSEGGRRYKNERERERDSVLWSSRV